MGDIVHVDASFAGVALRDQLSPEISDVENVAEQGLQERLSPGIMRPAYPKPLGAPNRAPWTDNRRIA